ncbi:MAG: dTMP kinase [Epulopiscium sp.]|nr:dTMP kinase [Candidatus Epulonipiscium sp.]
MKGYFISIEGTDGSGKTTQVQKILDYFTQKGLPVVFTREPGGTPIAEKIRDILLDGSHTALCSTAEILLYAASRAQHLEEKILPAIQEGKVVLSDRFSDSMVAYQGFGRGLDISWVEEVNAMATKGKMPDVTIYLDISPEYGIMRKKTDSEHKLDRLEQEALEFHQRVYEGYQYLWQKYPHRIHRVDATQSVEEVFVQIQKILDSLFEV